MERVTEKSTKPCVKQTTDGTFLCDSGNSKGLCDRWGGEGDGRQGTWVCLGLILVDA